VPWWSQSRAGRYRRAASTAAASFAAVTGTGFILDWHDSVRYWTGVVFSTSRPGSPAFVSNQAISGVLVRAGLDPHSQGGQPRRLGRTVRTCV
jgi:alpha-1,2-mannosyltransferase